MSNVTFNIRETHDHDGVTIYEVWQRNHTHGTERLLAETNTRAEARELQRGYATAEEATKGGQL